MIKASPGTHGGWDSDFNVLAQGRYCARGSSYAIEEADVELIAGEGGVAIRSWISVGISVGVGIRVSVWIGVGIGVGISVGVGIRVSVWIGVGVAFTASRNNNPTL